jgi:hypothetical protein
MNLHCRIPETVKAFEMSFEGVDYLVIEKGALAGLFEAAHETVAPAAASVRRGKVAKVKRVAVAKPIHAAAPVEMTRRPAPMQDAICQQLMRRPMTSAELGQVIGADKMPSIYTALATMRKAGDVVTVPDENGTRKNSLVAPRKAS